jgi:hypothetical protein
MQRKLFQHSLRPLLSVQWRESVAKSPLRTSGKRMPPTDPDFDAMGKYAHLKMKDEKETILCGNQAELHR